jgi:hypothetical protein
VVGSNTVNKSTIIKLIIFTPIFYVLALWSSVLLHEYAHTAVAWLFGFKTNPFAIQYGDFSWQNIFLVAYVNDTVNYSLIFSSGHPKIAGIIAFAGPGIATSGLYLITLYLLSCTKIKKHPYLFYFVFWLNIINLFELLSYVFLRAFSIEGDTGIAALGLGYSPWWTLILGGSLLIIALWYFFTYTLIQVYKIMKLESAMAQIIFLLLCTFLLFVLPGIYILLHIALYGVSTAILAGISCSMMPIMIIVCWPTRGWVKLKITKLKNG